MEYTVFTAYFFNGKQHPEIIIVKGEENLEKVKNELNKLMDNGKVEIYAYTERKKYISL
jgi:hypothetical protein